MLRTVTPEGKIDRIEQVMKEWELAGQPLDPKDPFFAKAEKPKPLKVWTPESIRALLQANDKAVGRALVALLDRQTKDERSTATTKHVNGRGFGSFDAGPMTGMARDFIARGYLTKGQLGWLRSCAGNSKTSRIGKYAGQLAEIANDKAEQKLAQAEAGQ